MLLVAKKGVQIINLGNISLLSDIYNTVTFSRNHPEMIEMEGCEDEPKNNEKSGNCTLTMFK